MINVDKSGKGWENHVVYAIQVCTQIESQFFIRITVVLMLSNLSLTDSINNLFNYISVLHLHVTSSSS